MTKYVILLIVILGSFALYSQGAGDALQRDPAVPVLTSTGSMEKSGQEIPEKLNVVEQGCSEICGDEKGTGGRQSYCDCCRAKKQRQFPKVMIHAFPYKQSVITVRRPNWRMSPDC